MNTGYLDTNITRALPQWLLWGTSKNLHDCISTLVISGTALSSAPTFQHIDFKLVLDSCYCYPYWWWWSIKFNVTEIINWYLYVQWASNRCIHFLKHYFSAMKWNRNTICVVFYSLKFFKSVHVQNVHLLPQFTLNNDVESGQLSECKASIFELAKLNEHSISRYQSHERIVWTISLGIVKKLAWLHQHSRYQWNFSFFRTDLSTHLAPFHRLQTSRNLVIVTLAGGGVLNSTLQRRSTSTTFSTFQ